MKRILKFKIEWLPEWNDIQHLNDRYLFRFGVLEFVIDLIEFIDSKFLNIKLIR